LRYGEGGCQNFGKHVNSNRYFQTVIVTDKGYGGKPACPEEWKMCKEGHE
jgi:hypothetical protein